MRANENALREETATTAYNWKFGVFGTLTLSSIFSKTIIHRAKPVSPMKTIFQGEQVARLSPHSENEKLSKK